MRNVLVTMRYEVEGADPRYAKMHDLSVASYRRNLIDVTDYVIFGGKARNLVEMYREFSGMVYDLIEMAPCNLLIVGADTICLKPMRVFHRFNDFRIFSEAGCPPPIWKDDILGEWNEDWRYLNVGAIYWPHEARHLAKIGRKYWEQAESFPNFYDFDQYVSNRLFYSQPSAMPLILHSELNFNLTIAGEEIPVPLPIQDAVMIHVHASRGPEKALERMRALWAECQVEAS